MFYHLCTNTDTGETYLYDTDDFTVGAVRTYDLDLLVESGMKINGYESELLQTLYGRKSFLRRLAFNIKYPLTVITESIYFYAIKEDYSYKIYYWYNMYGYKMVLVTDMNYKSYRLLGSDSRTILLINKNIVGIVATSDGLVLVGDNFIVEVSNRVIRRSKGVYCEYSQFRRTIAVGGI